MFSVRNIGTPVARQEVLKWTGEQWETIGISAGPEPSPALASITDIAAIESGPARGLYVAGTALDIADLPGLWELARWNGESWTPISIQSSSGFPPQIQSLASIQQGGSELLYIGGEVGSVWRWDGTTATERVVLLQGERFPQNVRQVVGFQGKVTVLRNDSSGGKIIVLEGDEWLALPPAPGGIESNLIYPSFRRLHVVHGPSGEYLYTTPSSQGSIGRADLLRYDGTNWSVVASEVNGPIYAVAANDDGTGPALYIGGAFSKIDGITSGFMAKRPFCDEQPCPADVTGDGFIDLADLNAVLSAFGQASDSGDANGDGSVDMTDLNIVLGAFGAVCK